MREISRHVHNTRAEDPSPSRCHHLQREQRRVLERNDLAPGDLVSIVFTATPDLTAEFPAVAARNLGLNEVPLLCAQEMAVPEAPAACIRVLIHHYGDRATQPVYLHGARALRSDLET
jgi:chorismate mutase